MSELNLNHILLDKKSFSNYVIDERGTIKKDGISVLTSRTGSTRFLFSTHSSIVAGIQVMKSKKKHIIANVYTLPKYQRKGYATKLYQAAKARYPKLAHADSLSKQGEEWKHSL